MLRVLTEGAEVTLVEGAICNHEFGAQGLRAVGFAAQRVETLLRQGHILLGPVARGECLAQEEPDLGKLACRQPGSAAGVKCLAQTRLGQVVPT
ncbi:MAG: hypothetical protein LAO07_09725, partial [Acidobacteriia bacterium]|nr:hypothetical protein [Terriglobia bacterium]